MNRLGSDENSNIYFDQKSVARDGNYLIATYLSLNLKDLTLPRYDLILGYEDRDFDIYINQYING